MSEPPRTSNIADAVFEDLRSRILSGALKAGERLAGERELAAEYRTNRNTLREAVRKLEQARLVSVRHGRGVTVADFKRTGTLELLSPYLQSGPDMADVVHIVEDVLAPRVLLIEYATRLAARRADSTDLHALRELSELLITAFEAKDAKVVARGFQRWLDALIDSGHSVAVRWIANPFLDALRDTLQRLPMLWVLEPSFPEYLRGIVNALEQDDEERAASITREYYERVDSQLLSLLRSAAPSSKAPKLSHAPAEPQVALTTEASNLETECHDVLPGSHE